MKRLFLTLLCALVPAFCLTGCAPVADYRLTETAHVKVPKAIPAVPQSPVPVEIPGLPNFGFVTCDVWRGGEPSADGLQTLATMGVKTVIDLRQYDESADIPKRVKYIRLPISGFHADQVDVAAVIRAIESNPKPVYVHCREGRDRTGIAIAAYRLSQGMSADDACQEMLNFHVNWFWERALTQRVHRLEETRALSVTNLKSQNRTTEVHEGTSDKKPEAGPAPIVVPKAVGKTS